MKSLYKKPHQFYQIVPLSHTNEQDILDSQTLQTEIYNELVGIYGFSQTFIHLKTPEELAMRMNPIYGMTWGVRLMEPDKDRILTPNRLISQATIRLSNDPEIALPSYFSDEKKEQTGCVEGILVHHDFRGNHLANLLIERLVDEAKTLHGKHYITSCVDASNPYSYNIFLNQGFGIAAAYIDPSDDGKTYALLKTPDCEKDIYAYHPEKRTPLEKGSFEKVCEILTERQLQSPPNQRRVLSCQADFHPECVCVQG